jgi:molecular chaperone Hsp33
MVVEVLPGASEDKLARLESNLAGLPGVSHLLESGGTEAVVGSVLAGLDREVRERVPLRYRCRCSRERLARHLVLLPPEDLASLQSDGGTIDADCVFCATRYRFTPEELAAGAPSSLR